MEKRFLTAAVALGCLSAAFAADADPVLMNIDGHDIRVSEFEYLYNKNNTQQVEPQSLDTYLGMFVNYKLKVADAEHAGLDTTETFNTEYLRYRDELAKPYMRDADVQQQLVEEAYNRRRTDVTVSHIMLSSAPTNEHKLDSIRNEILAGRITFEDAARQFSVDRGSNSNGGLMGMVMPDRYPYTFEKAAYDLENPGDISPVINSGVGYHIIRLESRKPTSGEVLAEHILLLTRGLDATAKIPVKAKIDSLYEVAVAGADFADLARRFSQDPGTARNGGRLEWFGRGAMVAPFDSAAFAIADGTISLPFETSFGYHIINKLESRGVPPLEDLRPRIERAISNDIRETLPEKAVIDRLLASRHAKLNDKNLKKVQKLIERNGGFDSTLFVRFSSMNMPLAKIDGAAPVQLSDAVANLGDLHADATEAMRLITRATEQLLSQQAANDYREQLALTNADYANLLNEYRDGMLLYEISNTNVWEKAAKDSIGLENYFRAHAGRYAWPNPKFKSFIIFASNDSVLNLATAYADSLSTDAPAAFATAMRTRFGRDVKVERVLAAKGENAITDHLAFGCDRPEPNASMHWPSYAAYKGRIIEAPENAGDVRGSVISDYQAELDRNWVEELHRKYSVKINQDVFDAVKARAL